jgi:uncharacterized protein YxjI
MKTLQFPLSFTFNIGTLANDFVCKDAEGQTVAYVRQKLFRLVDEVIVYTDESRSQEIYRINADRWIDFSANYTFTNPMGEELGRIARRGWISIWRANYELYDEDRKQDLLISEENPWIKVADNLLGEIPILSLFTGYILHPSYILKRPDGTEVARLIKEASFWGRKFRVEQLSGFDPGEQERIVLGLMMMILMERQRG